jgi:hypothetical protein
MLEAVGHPVAVNPDAKLERIAHDNGWPIVVFSKRTKAVVRRTTQAIGTAGVAAAGFAAGVSYTRRHLLGLRAAARNSVATTTAARRILGGVGTPTRIRRMRTGF